MSGTASCLASIPFRGWLWIQGYLFGSMEARVRLKQISAPINATEQANVTLTQLDQQINKYEMQARWRTNKISELRQTAKTLMIAGKKQEALSHLKEAKIHTGTLNSIKDRMIKFTTMGSTIMEATMNRDDSQVFQSAVSSLSMLRDMPGVDVEKVEEVMGELQEIVDDVGEASGALSRQLDVNSYVGDEVDDDDLEQELSELMAEDTNSVISNASGIGKVGVGANAGRIPGSQSINTLNLVTASKVVPGASIPFRRPMVYGGYTHPHPPPPQYNTMHYGIGRQQQQQQQQQQSIRLPVQTPVSTKTISGGLQTQLLA